MAKNTLSNKLGPVDNAFLYAEKPETPMNIGALTLFEGQIDFQRFLKLIDSKLHLAPRYRQRLIQDPLHISEPSWIFDPEFHVSNHVFRLTVDPPGTEEQLRELVGHLVSGMLDRKKPLWEIYMIDGLQKDRTAVFFKIHHCMVDGLAAVELLTLLFDLVPTNKPIPKKPLYDPPYLPGKVRLTADAIRSDLSHKFKIMRKIGRDVGQLLSVVRDKEKRRKAFVGLAYLANDNLKPIKKLAINGQNTGKQTLAWAEFSLAEVRAIRSARNCSVNDVMLTIMASAVERYLKVHGDQSGQEFFRMLIPVSMRLEKEKDDLGNRISVLPVDVPFGISDMLERLEVVTQYTKVMKESSLANTADMILTIPSLTPANLQKYIWKIAPLTFGFIAHMWCTNVPGPQIPIYLMEHKMLHSFGYFPLNPPMGISCVISSYNQRINMTLVSDIGIVPDVTEITRYLQDAFVALRKAANVQPKEPIEVDRVEAKASTSKATGEKMSSATKSRKKVSASSNGASAGEGKEEVPVSGGEQKN